MDKKQVRIGVDLTGIWRRPTGIFRYAAEVAKSLLHEADESVHYVFFFAREVHPDFKPLMDSFEPIICPTTNELLIKQIWFPLILPRLRLDVIHYPAFPPPLLHLFGPRSVMTFHDAGPWRYADTLTLHGRIYFRTLLAQGVRTCTSVITVSTHAKAEIGTFLGNRYLPKITIIPEAARPEFALACSDEYKAEVRNKYTLPAHYFFAVATVEPRKNLVTLLHAYKQLKQQLQVSGTICPPLVIVGRKGWNCDDILGYMTDLEGSVLFPGHVSDEELIALYQMAMCLVFPSLYEGFGLPVLEAMMAGCPVITSNTSSLPEVAGEAALLVDPLNADAIATAMYQILDDPGVGVRMVQNGYRQVQRFSWQETARRTQEVYMRVAHQ
ncbi:MAG: glycosyltransferase family 1 protein [Ktedonobacteraceae bacterium]